MFALTSRFKKSPRSRDKSVLWLTLLFLTLIQGAAVSAKTLSVPDSSPTIKGALIKAQPGDIVLVSCGTYFEHDIMMKPGVALWSGTLQPGCVTIDAQGKGRVFNFTDADTNTALVGFTLKGGQAQQPGDNLGGALSCRNSSPRISNCVFVGNKAASGGALFVDHRSSPVLSNCLFEKNDAASRGGGAYCQGTTTFRQCAFVENSALVGGGLNLEQGAFTHLFSCSFLENSAGNTGGGLHAQRSQCNITHTIFSTNWGGLGGSAISSFNADLKLNHGTLYRNANDTGGGDLAFQGKLPLVKNSIIAFSQGSVLKGDSEIPGFQGCNLFGNATGDWVANLRSLGEMNKNISFDPQFCSPEYGNFTLKSSSACLPGNNPSGNKSIVGAFGPGCAPGGEQSRGESRSASGFQAVKAGL